MKFSNTLYSKFGRLESQNSQVKGNPISNNLKTFLQNESQRIDNLITNKKNYEAKIKMAEQINLHFRDGLRNKIDEDQKRHEKKRKEYFEKKAKNKLVKMQERKRKKEQQCWERQKYENEHIVENSENPQNPENPNIENHEEPIKNENKTKEKLGTKLGKQRLATQTATPVSMYEEAISKKKMMEEGNHFKSRQLNEKLLSKYLIVNKKKESQLKSKRAIWEQHNKRIERGLQRNKEIQQEKEKKIVNGICFHQMRSVTLLKSQKKAWIKKLKGKHMDEKQLREKRKQALINKIDRAKSTQQMRNQNRKNSNNSFEVIVSSDENQETEKCDQVSNVQNSVQDKRKTFLLRKKTNCQNVKANRSLQRCRQEINDEKVMMTQNESKNALRIKEDIKTESNLLVRQVRMSV